jgi:hypothetical protein
MNQEGFTSSTEIVLHRLGPGRFQIPIGPVLLRFSAGQVERIGGNAVRGKGRPEKTN